MGLNTAAIVFTFIYLLFLLPPPALRHFRVQKNGSIEPPSSLFSFSHKVLGSATDLCTPATLAEKTVVETPSSLFSFSHKVLG